MHFNILCLATETDYSWAKGICFETKQKVELNQKVTCVL